MNFLKILVANDVYNYGITIRFLLVSKGNTQDLLLGNAFIGKHLDF